MATPNIRKITSNKEVDDETTKGTYKELKITSEQNNSLYEQVGHKQTGIERGPNRPGKRNLQPLWMSHLVKNEKLPGS